MFRESLPSGLDQLRREAARQIFLEREHRLRLRPIAFEDDRQRLLNVVERGVDDVLADASRERLPANAGEPF